MPHQGIVALSISAFSIFLTLCVLFYTLREEKKNQARNPSDKH